MKKVLFSFVYSLVILLSFTSCKKYDEDGYRVFTIKEGKHRSTFDIDRTSKSILYFSCIFDSNCEYLTDDPVNQFDINKLYGLSDCGTSHSKNSVRFGWRWDNIDNSIEINSYVRIDGVFQFKKICNVNLNEPNDYSIQIYPDHYIFTVGNIESRVDKECDFEGERYKLYPYFGGDEEAPHNMTIRIKEY